jgi:hypothetical protein
MERCSKSAKVFGCRRHKKLKNARETPRETFMRRVPRGRLLRLFNGAPRVARQKQKSKTPGKSEKTTEDKSKSRNAKEENESGQFRLTGDCRTERSK